MKCYFCGKDGLDKVMRFWQDGDFRNACDECFTREMTKAGNILHDDGYWYKSEQEVTQCIQ